MYCIYVYILYIHDIYRIHIYTQLAVMDADLVLSQSDSRPMYLQIMDQIKQRIALGDWRIGEKLLSIRELAVGLKVSVITVKRAYAELEKEGVIVTQHGKGSFISTGAELGEKINLEELDRHLQEAARLADILGIGTTELTNRLTRLQQDTKRVSDD